MDVSREFMSPYAMLAKVVSDNQKDWCQHIPFMPAYRTSHHETTCYSPNFFISRREVLVPADLVCGRSLEGVEQEQNPDDYAHELYEPQYTVMRSCDNIWE